MFKRRVFFFICILAGTLTAPAQLYTETMAATQSPYQAGDWLGNDVALDVSALPAGGYQLVARGAGNPQSRRVVVVN